MRIALIALTAMLVHGMVAAQDLRLEIREGRVTLDAREVSVDRILAQWETVGGTAIVGRDQISLPPVTLRLEGVTEREALDAILRGVPGFVAQQRAVLMPNASIFDRIVILARSIAPAATAASTHAAAEQPAIPAGLSEPTAPPHQVSLPVAVLAPGTETENPAQGLTGRRAPPGMVPVAIPPKKTPRP